MVKDCVITLPPFFDAAARRALIAGELTGIERAIAVQKCLRCVSCTQLPPPPPPPPPPPAPAYSPPLLLLLRPLRAAASIAGLNVLSLMHESTAFAFKCATVMTVLTT